MTLPPQGRMGIKSGRKVTGGRVKFRNKIAFLKLNIKFRKASILEIDNRQAGFATIFSYAVLKRIVIYPKIIPIAQ